MRVLRGRAGRYGTLPSGSSVRAAGGVRRRRRGESHGVPESGPRTIRRIARRLAELPPPSDPDPAQAAVVQALMGGKFGEMSDDSSGDRRELSAVFDGNHPETGEPLKVIGEVANPP